MALKFFNRRKAEAESAADSPPTTTLNHKDEKYDADPERQGSYLDGSRRKSRIDTLPVAGDDASGLSLGAQLEMEKDNGIQYRTCGWKKVCL